MTVQILQWTAAVYLATGLVAGLSLGSETRRMERASVVLLAFGALLHLLSFALLHTAENPPPVTNMREAFSFMAWVGVVFYLIFLKRYRLQRLVVFVAPGAFLGAFLAALRPPTAVPVEAAPSAWPWPSRAQSSNGSNSPDIPALFGGRCRR